MLTLGKAFDRSYSLRVAFLDGFYNISIFFNKKSAFLLFALDGDFPPSCKVEKSVKVNMFKNLEASRFCATFLKLHNYRNQSLDIINQFESIRPDYESYVVMTLNETITLAKFKEETKEYFDSVTLYGFTMPAYSNEFIFLIAERQNIVRKLRKKVVRSTGLQIATSSSIQLLNDFYQDSMKGKQGATPQAFCGTINLTAECEE